MLRSNLQTGDVIVSRKSSKESLAQALFNGACALVGRRRYGDTGFYLESSHVRGVVLNPITKTHKVFHWTAPEAEIGPLRDWMLDPSYAVIVRANFPLPSHMDLYRRAVQAVGMNYNYGLLLDILVGWEMEFFSLGLENEVCSTGIARWLAQDLARRHGLFRRYIPADFINLPSRFLPVGERDITQIPKLKPEPTGT